MTKGKTKGKRECKSTYCENKEEPAMSMESINQGPRLLKKMGGVAPRFQTEAQRKLYLRLKAKQAAKAKASQ